MVAYLNGTKIDSIITQEVTFNYDSVSDTFAFTVPYDNNVRWKPLTYPTLEIYDRPREERGCKKLLTGTVINHAFDNSPNANEVSISGYSATGILDDCPNITEELQAANETPQETEGDSDSGGFLSSITSFFLPDTKTGQSSCFNGVSLLELAKTLVKPFGIDIVVDAIVNDKMNEPYDQCTVSPEESVASYLAKLATYKNVVMRATPYGQLRFTQIDRTAKPVIIFSTADLKNIVTFRDIDKISIHVNGQNMYYKTYVTARETLSEDADTDANKTALSDNIINPLVGLKTREMLHIQGTEITRIPDVAMSVLADQLKNIEVTIELPGWITVDGVIESVDQVAVNAPKGRADMLSAMASTSEQQWTSKTNKKTKARIIAPGDLVGIYSPGIFLNNIDTWMVRSVQLKENAAGRNSTITCVLPETMTGEQPAMIFGGEAIQERKIQNNVSRGRSDIMSSLSS